MEVSAPPRLDGLPLWAQILVSLVFGCAALGAAIKGYLTRESSGASKSEPASTAILAASITDMGAIRHLSDVCIILTGKIEQLAKAIDESTYHERNAVEVNRELCGRTRELAERVEELADEMRRGAK